MERFFPVILNKYKTFGLQRLTPAEICLTALHPGFVEYFYDQTGQVWQEVLDDYMPILENHLEHPEKLSRFAAGKVFLQCLDLNSNTSQSIPKYSLPDDAVLRKISEEIKQKNKSLLKILVQSDTDCDGFMTKSELVSALEKLELSPYDIVSCIRVAGFRPNINFVPIAGFCDLISRSSSERKLKEFTLLTKLLNIFSTHPGGIDQLFKSLDKNHDNKLTFEEFRNGIRTLNLNLSLKDCKNVFALLDRDNSKSISLIEFKRKLQEMGARPKRVVSAQRAAQFDPPGLFTIKFLNGTLPHSSVLSLEIQNNRANTTLFPVWGEAIRLKGNKRANCVLRIDFESSSAMIDLSPAVSKECKMSTKIGKFEVCLIVRFDNVCGEDFKEMRAAEIIQKAWHVYQEKVQNSKSKKKLMSRKTVTAFGKRFLLAAYSIEKGLYCQLHPAFTDQIPQDTVLSYASFQTEELEQILSQIIVNPNLSLSLVPDKSRIRGNLWVELVKLNNVVDLKLGLGEDLKDLTAVGDKVEFRDVKASKPVDLAFSANGGKGNVFWVHALACPYRWSVPAIVVLPGKASFSVRFKWLIGARLGEIEQAVIFIQKQWKEKQKKRKVVGKRGRK